MSGFCPINVSTCVSGCWHCGRHWRRSFIITASLRRDYRGPDSTLDYSKEYKSIFFLVLFRGTGVGNEVSAKRRLLEVDPHYLLLNIKSQLPTPAINRRTAVLCLYNCLSRLDARIRIESRSWPPSVLFSSPIS